MFAARIVTSSVDRSMASEREPLLASPWFFVTPILPVSWVGNICIDYEQGVNKAILHVVELGITACSDCKVPPDNRTAVTSRMLWYLGSLPAD